MLCQSAQHHNDIGGILYSKTPRIYAVVVHTYLRKHVHDVILVLKLTEKLSCVSFKYSTFRAQITSYICHSDLLCSAG